MARINTQATQAITYTQETNSKGQIVKYAVINGRKFKINPETGVCYFTYYEYTKLDGSKGLFKGPVDLLLNSNMQLAPEKEAVAPVKIADRLNTLEDSMSTIASALQQLITRK